MEWVEPWWQIAQVAGAGMAMVALPTCWQLWKKVQADAEYIREADKGMLNVLHELTKTLEGRDAKVDANHTAVLNAIEQATNTLKNHVHRG